MFFVGQTPSLGVGTTFGPSATPNCSTDTLMPPLLVAAVWLKLWGMGARAAIERLRRGPGPHPTASHTCVPGVFLRGRGFAARVFQPGALRLGLRAPMRSRRRPSRPRLRVGGTPRYFSFEGSNWRWWQLFRRTPFHSCFAGCGPEIPASRWGAAFESDAGWPHCSGIGWTRSDIPSS